MMLDWVGDQVALENDHAHKDNDAQAVPEVDIETWVLVGHLRCVESECADDGVEIS